MLDESDSLFEWAVWDTASVDFFSFDLFCDDLWFGILMWVNVTERFVLVEMQFGNEAFPAFAATKDCDSCFTTGDL